MRNYLTAVRSRSTWARSTQAVYPLSEGSENSHHGLHRIKPSCQWTLISISLVLAALHIVQFLFLLLFRPASSRYTRSRSPARVTIRPTAPLRRASRRSGCFFFLVDHARALSLGIPNRKTFPSTLFTAGKSWALDESGVTGVTMIRLFHRLEMSVDKENHHSHIIWNSVAVRVQRRQGSMPLQHRGIQGKILLPGGFHVLVIYQASVSQADLSKHVWRLPKKDIVVRPRSCRSLEFFGSGPS